MHILSFFVLFVVNIVRFVFYRNNRSFLRYRFFLSFTLKRSFSILRSSCL